MLLLRFYVKSIFDEFFSFPDWINEAGGEVVSIEFEGEIDYLVTHFKFDLAKKQNFAKMNPRKMWTYLWLEDCLDHGKIVEWQFYHEPITIDKDLKPCAGM